MTGAQGSSSPTANVCPAGTYGVTPGQVDYHCSGECSAGYYCLAGSTSANSIPCPAGSYGALTGAKTSLCDGLCAIGYYCPAGSTSGSPCPAGRFGNVTGLATASCSGDCAIGYYCLAASTSAEAAVCPAGSYGITPGKRTLELFFLFLECQGARAQAPPRRRVPDCAHWGTTVRRAAFRRRLSRAPLVATATVLGVMRPCVRELAG